MEKIWVPVLALAAVVLQTTVLYSWRIAGVAPDLVFLLVIFLALQKPNTLGLWIAFAVGLVQDVASGGPMGMNALVLVGLAYLAGHMRKQFFKENYTTQMLIVLIFTLGHQFLIFFWMNTIMDMKFTLLSWIGRALLLSLVHALLAPVLFSWLSRMVPGDDVYKHLISQRTVRFNRRT